MKLLSLLDVTQASQHPVWLRLLAAVLFTVASGLAGFFLFGWVGFDSGTLSLLAGVFFGHSLLGAIESGRLRRIIRDAGIDENVNN